MTSRNVTSPAGESIEIIDDEDWMELTDTNAGGIHQWVGSKPYIITELWLSGAVHDPQSGRATKVLADAVRERFPDVTFGKDASFSTMFQTATNRPALERDLNGKRCYSIRLVALPETWYRKMLTFIKNRGLGLRAPIKPNPEPQPESQPSADWVGEWVGEEPVPIDQVKTEETTTVVEDFAPPLELSMASQVAMSLLTTVVEIISAGSPETVDQRVRKLQADYDEVIGRLNARLTENDSLRKQLRVAGDDIAALRSERDGLRQRVKATEANLSAAMNGDAVQAVNGEIMRRVDQIMRVAPSTKKGGD